MNFTASREDLVLAIARAVQGLPAHAAQPVRLGILLQAADDRVRLTTSDGDVTFTASCDADITAPGSVIVPGKMTGDISRYFNGREVSISCDGGAMELRAGRAVFRLPVSPGEDYPSWAGSPAASLGADGADFAAAVRKVLPAASDADPVYRSVCAELTDEDRLVLVCTDKFRLAVSVPVTRTLPLPGENSRTRRALLPVPVMDRIARLAQGELQMGWDQNLLSIAFPGLAVTARLVQGEYLDWLRLLAKADEHVTADISKEELTRLVKAAVLTSGASGTVRLAFADGDVMLSSSAENGEYGGSADAHYHGEPLTLRLGGQMLLDALAGCDDMVHMAFTAPLKPVLLLGGGGYRHMLQPRREL